MSDLPVKVSRVDRQMKRLGLERITEQNMPAWFAAYVDAQMTKPLTHTTIMTGNFQIGYTMRVWCDRAVTFSEVSCSSYGEVAPAWRCPTCGLRPGREKEGVLIDTDQVTAWPALPD